MTARVAVFPGQGSQAVGMGKALAEAFPAARAVFEEVDQALGERLSDVVFNGPTSDLTLTANAQPALFATSLAAVRALEATSGRRLPSFVDHVAGHSLGEYSALVAVDAIGIADAARLLRQRGAAMQDAVPAGDGAMAAILGLDPLTAETVAEEAALGEVCEIANDNADGQAVVSGHVTAVERAMGLAKDKGAKRCVMLEVSAPFHCALMAPAAERLADALSEVMIKAPAVPVVTNVTATAVQEPDLIRELLARQVTARVRWRETMLLLAASRTETVIELGAGKVLTGLARRAVPGAMLLNVQTPADVDAAARALGGS